MYVSNDWDALAAGKKGRVTPLATGTEAEGVFFKGRETDSYGEFLQGEDEVYVVFKVGDKYYKKFGYQSSYGYGIEWTGVVVEVKPIVKTIQVFE